VALPLSDNLEWLEPDGLGGFASGTASGLRTRRYHALLLAATTPPTGRFVLVNGVEAWVETPSGPYPLTTHCYWPDLFHPNGKRRLDSFEAEPWPQWTYRLDDGTRVRQEVFVPHGVAAVAVSWRLLDRRKDARLKMRPLLSGRDYHHLQRENGVFQFEPQVRKGMILWQPYPGVPGVVAFTNGLYSHAPNWYRNFLYLEEQARGLDCIEDLASPGIFSWDLSEDEALCLFVVEGQETQLAPVGVSAEACFRPLRLDEERRRRHFPTRLDRAAEAYLVKRGRGQTIVAGYPWFTDWGRDTFISLRGLCLARGQVEEAGQILLEWAGTVSEGMLPNRFLDQGQQPEFNSVDASLWFVVAVHDYLRAARRQRHEPDPREARSLIDAIDAVVAGYSRGTRYGIRMDVDGLLAAGVPGVQLTWMDAKVGDWVVTPRVGKPVEVQALWLNALHVHEQLTGRRPDALARGLEAFRTRFWNAARGCLYDVLDVDHRVGAVDAALRPNQVFAAGGLPLMLLEEERARQVLDVVEDRLWTPLGLRTLAPGERDYRPRCEGDVRQRDGAYHQGPTWPWLLGPFVEAWVRVRGSTQVAKAEARARFLEPLLRHLDACGLGHLPEVADAELPQMPRGCPFQAWSVAEALRLDRLVLSEEREPPLGNGAANGTEILAGEPANLPRRSST
jgi:predicted glycogen debranching enzyme